MANAMSMRRSRGSMSTPGADIQTPVEKLCQNTICSMRAVLSQLHMLHHSTIIVFSFQYCDSLGITSTGMFHSQGGLSGCRRLLHCL